MIKRDYILRMIEQVARTIHQALGLVRGGDYEAGLRVLDEAFESLFGWSSQFVNTMPEEYLEGMLRTGERPDLDQMALLAVLLRTEGDLYAEMDEPNKAYHRHLRALHLFLTVHESDGKPTLPDEWDQTKELIDTLAEYELPKPTMHRLWAYFRDTGQWAEAEDTLWRLLERADDEAEHAQLTEQGRAFYRTLLQQPDTILAAGGLPRAEVEDALRELG